MNRCMRILSRLMACVLVVAALVLTLAGPLSAQAQICTDIAVGDAKTMIDSDPSVVILDVRTQAEYDAVHIEGATLIPLSELAGRLGELSSGAATIVHCKAGTRSWDATYNILCPGGFTEVYNMLGGIDAWMAAYYPVQHRDLVIGSLSRDWVVVGEYYNVTFTVCNTGTLEAGASDAGIYANGSLEQTEPIGVLGAGECTAPITVGTITCTSCSDPVITVYADSDDVILESNCTLNHGLIS